MSDQKLPESGPTDNTAAPQAVNTARRRLGKAALAAPVLASLAARPALACSVSGFMSGNVSPGHKPSCEGSGCTPGYWKNNPEVWPKLTRYSAGVCAKWNNPKTQCKEWQIGGTTLKDILPAGCNPYPYHSDQHLLYLLVEAQKGRSNTLTQIAHYIAAILNAAAAEIAYGSSVSQVQAGLCKALANEAKDPKRGVEYYTLTVLAKLNERGCMFDAHGNCETNFVLDGIYKQCIPACKQGEQYDVNLRRCVPKTTTG